jgi:hypothetical protein
MIIDVYRFTSDADTTLSLVSVDSKFVCFGLEDEYRVKKLYAETRIPAGSYPITLRKIGALNELYKARFPDIHEGMLYIRNVPGFEFILIHCGNTDDDSAGCLLVGSAATSYELNMSIAGSAIAYRNLYRRVVDAARDGTLSIHFRDGDR